MQIEWITFEEYKEDTQAPIDSFSGKWSFLSNFYPVEIEYEFIKYPTAEHVYQAAKTIHSDKRREIQQLKYPSQAKKAGKLVELRNDWDKIKVSIMEDILRLKFKPHTDLAIQLAQTYNRPLIEGNSWKDRFWGVCENKGQNNLGKILMKIRFDLIPSYGIFNPYK